MINGERQAEVEVYKYLVALVYRVVLLFSTWLYLRVWGWTIWIIDPRLRDMTKAYRCKAVEGVCESM